MVGGWQQVVQKKLAMLTVLHDLILVSQFADKAAIMSKGKIVEISDAEEVITDEIISRVYHAQVEVI